MLLTLLTTTGVSAAVDNTARALGPLLLNQDYVVTATASCWIQQGTNKRITCLAKANLVDGDTVTIGVSPDGTKTYEFDVAGNGVAPGHVQVNVPSDTTAAQVAARLRAAIAANQPSLTLTDNADGTLDVRVLDDVATFAEAVANAGFTVTDLVMPVSAGSAATLVTPGLSPVVNGNQGPQLAVIQDGTSTGRACLTRCQRF